MRVISSVFLSAKVIFMPTVVFSHSNLMSVGFLVGPSNSRSAQVMASKMLNKEVIPGNLILNDLAVTGHCSDLKLS